MIGVFDSGYGGLTVLKPLAKKFPQYDFIYFGDNAHAPYGSRSQEDIYKYTLEAVDWLFHEKCELIILACNTASSQALRKIQQEYLPEYHPDKKVLGVLIPVAQAAAKLNGTVGILATEATVESEAYLREIHKLVKHRMFDIVQTFAPLLVPLIESGKINNPEIKDAVCEYLKEFKKYGVKNIILGCTHYPLIKHLIQKEMPEAKIFDSPSVIPESLENYLLRHPEIEKYISRNGIRRYATTGDPKKFSKFAKDFLKIEIIAEQITKLI
ncbi:MAG: glutamate racemase [Candidatus Taylorbacteria bacterium RIFCSPLOWO2_12_FULL_44_9]|nr:MAG: glutamate racemase [Candidatus Taylorbacteria bacterium RIFCSPLOWO2_12_FULL_44_9]